MEGGRDSGDDAPTRRYPPAAVSLLPPGTVLNAIYRIERRLGGGGMGEVYLAVNVENDERDAIKVMAPNLASDPQVEAMFRREAAALRMIHSPAVAQIRLFAREPQLGLLYMATEYVDGPSLADVMKRGPGNPAALVTLIRRVATGMKAAHDANRVHRDLSPDNIILPGGDPGAAKVIDFGVVKNLDPHHGTIGPSGMMGKLSFMAPEQFGESGSRIGPWTDVYGLALVGIAFAAGKPLDLGVTVGSAMEARRHPIDLGALPPTLRPLFASMLVHDWRKRLASMDAVLAGLADGGGITPDPPRPRLRRGLIAATAAAALAAATGVALFWRPDPAPVATVTPPDAPAPLAPSPTPSAPRPAFAEAGRGDAGPVPGDLVTPTPIPTPSPAPSARTPAVVADAGRASDRPRPAGVCSPGPFFVFFEWDKSDITPEAASVLDNVVKAYQSCGDARVMLAGHTDRAGSARYNAGLSERMASSVGRYLAGHGIPAGSISSEAFGESRPRVDTADGAREVFNRRVEITFGPAAT